MAKSWAEMTDKERQARSAADAHERRKTEESARARGQMRAVIKQVAAKR
jgi:hypothetical protein